MGIRAQKSSPLTQERLTPRLARHNSTACKAHMPPPQERDRYPRSPGSRMPATLPIWSAHARIISRRPARYCALL